MPNNQVPHNDFQAGFIVGWQAIRETSAGIPAFPGNPARPETRRRFFKV